MRLTFARPDGWKAVAILALGAALGLTVNSLAGAALPGPATTQVDFVSLPAPKSLVNNGAFQAGQTKAFVVIGGSTTVPSNATTVRLHVVVKNAAGGSLSVSPSGNPASPTTVSWAANATVTQDIGVNVGLSNKIDVKNNSAGTATVTVQITGYSTQVTAAGINGSGGSNGQVLTSNGPGAAVWKTPAAGPAGYIARNSNLFINIPPPPATVDVVSLTVPAGTYQVTAAITVTATGLITCDLYNTSNQVAEVREFNTNDYGTAVLPAQMLMQTTGGTIRYRCRGAGVATQASLIAVRLGSATGAVS